MRRIASLKNRKARVTAKTYCAATTRSDSAMNMIISQILHSHYQAIPLYDVPTACRLTKIKFWVQLKSGEARGCWLLCYFLHTIALLLLLLLLLPLLLLLCFERWLVEVVVFVLIHGCFTASGTCRILVLFFESGLTEERSRLHKPASLGGFY